MVMEIVCLTLTLLLGQRKFVTQEEHRHSQMYNPRYQRFIRRECEVHRKELAFDSG